jgi:hypothetical protein
MNLQNWCEKLFGSRVKKIDFLNGEIGFEPVDDSSEVVILKDNEQLTQKDKNFIETIYLNKDTYVDKTLTHYNKEYSGKVTYPFFIFYSHKEWKISFTKIDTKEEFETILISFKGDELLSIEHITDGDQWLDEDKNEWVEC